MTKEFKLELDPSIDEVFDEVPGNSFLALRRLRWTETGNFRLDIRKWYTNNQGEEIAGKGVSFMTEEGPDNLIAALLKHGYGDTEKTIDAIKDREDFISIATAAIMEKNPDFDGSFFMVKDPEGSGDFYDPKEFFDVEEDKEE